MEIEFKKEKQIAVITLNRPEVLNAINAELSSQLNDALVQVKDDPEIWVAIITGAGDRAFSAGADIRGFQPGPRAAAAPRLRIDQIWKPFIAAIHGFCLGGGLEMALTCDLRIAANNARFGLPEIKVGIIPAGGGMSRLPRFIPRAKAAEMLLTGQFIDAAEAYRVGLVNTVVPREELMPTAMRWATTICEAGPLQIRAVKEVMLRGYNMPLDDSLKLEREISNGIRQTEDFVEGTRAFVEKRKPQWKGR